MVTAEHSQIAHRRATTRDYEEILSLVNRAFERQEGADLRKDFPTALHPGNLEHMFIGRIDGKLVATVVALVRPWRTGAGWLDTACVGSVATDTRMRGRGLSAGLQRWALRQLAAEGVDWALLWTDTPDLFARRGFRPVGLEHHATLRATRWPSLPSGAWIRRAEPKDAPALLRLYESHRLRAQRDVEDVRLHLDPAVSHVELLEDARGIRAYAATGKGLDFSGYLHDYAGEPADVHLLWAKAHREGRADWALIPSGAEGYALVQGRPLPCRRQPSAHAVALSSHVAFADGLDGLDFAVWGFDSA